MFPALHQIDEQRTLQIEVVRPHREVVLQRCHHLIRNGHHIVFVHPALPLDVQHILSVQHIEVANVDAGHLAGAQTIGEHQLDHKIVSGSHNVLPINGGQKVIALLSCQRQLVMLLGAEVCLDARTDIIVVAHRSAVLVEYLDDGHIAIDGEDGLALLLELLLVAQYIGPAGCPGIDALSRQPAEPEVYLPPVI